MTTRKSAQSAQVPFIEAAREDVMETQHRPSHNQHFFLGSCAILALNELYAGDTARIQTVTRRHPLYVPGDAPEAVYLLKVGSIKLSLCTESGKELTLAILKPGDLVGVVEALDGSPREALAEALEDVVLAALPREDFIRRMRQNPHLAMELTKLIGFSVRRLHTRLQVLAFQDVPSRLVQLLLELGKTAGTASGSGLRIGTRITHQEIANLIGCTRETVTATLGRLREQGLLRTDGRSLTLVDVPRLQGLLSHSPTRALDTVGASEA